MCFSSFTTNHNITLLPTTATELFRLLNVWHFGRWFVSIQFGLVWKSFPINSVNICFRKGNLNLNDQCGNVVQAQIIVLLKSKQTRGCDNNTAQLTALRTLVSHKEVQTAQNNSRFQANVFKIRFMINGRNIKNTDMVAQQTAVFSGKHVFISL